MSHKPPQLFTHCGEQLGLTSPQTCRWWRATCQAKTPAAASFRLDLRFMDCRHWTGELVEAFLTSTFTPTRCCLVLEALVQEQQLTRAEASAIENAILSQTDASGRWVSR